MKIHIHSNMTRKYAYEVTKDVYNELLSLGAEISMPLELKDYFSEFKAEFMPEYTAVSLCDVVIAIYLDTADAALMNGKRILIVDDVISTGESLNALETLVEKAGGIICGRMAILAEGDAIDREDLIFLEELPLFNADGTIKA